MKLYFAGYSTDKNLKEVPEVKHLLESYLYFKNKDFVEWHRNRGLLDRNIFLDSGAFSAFTRGEKIDIDNYISFIKKNIDFISVYATLDVIGDWRGTKENMEYMESCGLLPLPIFHFGSPKEELHRVCNKYDYIALGGLVPYSTRPKILQKWLDSCFNIIMNYKKNGNIIKIHGFGVNALWAWKRYPFYSVDATSWLSGGKFRTVLSFDGNKFVIHNKHFGSKTIKRLQAHNDWHGNLSRHNMLEYLKAADYVTRLWSRRGIIFND